MDLETIMIVGGTASLVCGGMYGVRTFLPKWGSALGAQLGYALGEGIGQGITQDVHKAFVGEELDQKIFDSPEARAERWNYTKPVLTSYLGLSASVLALSLGVCSGVPLSLAKLMIH